MRNIAVAALRQLGFGGAAVAAAMGLTPLRGDAAPAGAAGGDGGPGPRARPAPGDRRGVVGAGAGRGGRPGCGTPRSRGGWG